jgi:hypothetical protein
MSHTRTISSANAGTCAGLLPLSTRLCTAFTDEVPPEIALPRLRSRASLTVSRGGMAPSAAQSAYTKLDRIVSTTSQ